MYCPKCGALNPDHARLCRACGQVVTPDEPTTGAHVSGWATAALVLGILSAFTCLLTALPAIVAGIVAMVKIGNSNGRLKGVGMAIAGMALPFALLPFMAIAIGMGIRMPALARVRQLQVRMTCGTNLQGLGKAMLIYANDYNDRFPTTSKWCDLLTQYAAVAPQVFQCKGGGGEGPCNYAMNKAVESLGPNAPPDMVLVFETAPGWNQTGGAEILTVENHQGDGCNVLFVDTHVEFVKPEGLAKLRWTAGDPAIKRPDAR